MHLNCSHSSLQPRMAASLSDRPAVPCMARQAGCSNCRGSRRVAGRDQTLGLGSSAHSWGPRLRQHSMLVSASQRPQHQQCARAACASQGMAAEGPVHHHNCTSSRAGWTRDRRQLSVKNVAAAAVGSCTPRVWSRICSCPAQLQQCAAAHNQPAPQLTAVRLYTAAPCDHQSAEDEEACTTHIQQQRTGISDSVVSTGAGCASLRRSSRSRISCRSKAAFVQSCSQKRRWCTGAAATKARGGAFRKRADIAPRHVARGAPFRAAHSSGSGDASALRQSLYQRKNAQHTQHNNVNTGATVPRNVASRALSRAECESEDGVAFVRHFRSASPYISGHRDNTFLIVLPGEVITDQELLVRSSCSCQCCCTHRQKPVFQQAVGLQLALDSRCCFPQACNCCSSAAGWRRRDAPQCAQRCRYDSACASPACFLLFVLLWLLQEPQ